MITHESTYRIIKILEILGAKKSLSIDEIVESTNIPYTSVYRILKTFLNHNYMEVNEEKKFKLTLKFFNNISSGMTSFSSFAQIAHPCMQRLNYQTKETIHLGILTGTKVTYIDKIDSTHLLRMHSYIGYQADIYCTALGKCLLAWLPFKVLEVLVPQLEFKKLTKNTITHKKKFFATLEKIKEDGYSIDDEENEAHLHCLAMPIFDANNHVTAAISISQPMIRFNQENHESYLNYLGETARDISILLENKSYQDCLKGNIDKK